MHLWIGRWDLELGNAAFNVVDKSIDQGEAARAWNMDGSMGTRAVE